MDKLRECPFCGSEAVLEKPMEDYPNCLVRCKECRVSTAWYAKLEDAIAAWNRRLEPENKPLTLDELKARDRRPVWISDGEFCGWTICKADSAKQVYFDDTLNLAVYLKDYGKTWLTYDHPPKE